MKIALDTNVLVDLWNGTAQGQNNALILYQLRQAGDTLLICGAVRAELQAHPTLDATQIDTLLSKMGVEVDWTTGESIWRSAGQAHADVTERRRRERNTGGRLPRRPLVDHLIGAHASHRADRLLTRNVGDFSDFPDLQLLRC